MSLAVVDPKLMSVLGVVIAVAFIGCVAAVTGYLHTDKKIRQRELDRWLEETEKYANGETNDAD